MADFCRQCSILLFGEDTKDLACVGESDLEPDEGFAVICEGCGPTLVDHKGQCLGGCLEHHKKPAKVYLTRRSLDED